MAIAYFIPDQAKLLAGQRSNNSRNRSSNRSNTEATRSTIPSNRTTEANPLHAATTNNRAYGTTINITVPNLNATPEEPLGCWDFLTQVFCYALRFYHESSQLQPTVIQISVNFNAQTQNTTTTTTTTTPATTTMATVNESNTTIDSASNSSSANSDRNNLATAAVINSPRKCSKRKN
ncbi:hypothetical protein DOY81_006388 [Sarcophaga bullata]|nr:hypothetical protein DOY81_006388 [Sarcophaga bullata]